MERGWPAERLDAGRSIEAIAREVGQHPSTVAYWVNKHGLRSRYVAKHAARGPLAVEDLEPLVESGMTIRQIARELDRSPTTPCVTGSGTTAFAPTWRDYRRNLKEILVDEAGGRCAICGYDRYPGALQFHHVDPGTKLFDLSGRGITRSLERARAEARKCVLLCANCQAEVGRDPDGFPYHQRMRRSPG